MSEDSDKPVRQRPSEHTEPSDAPIRHIERGGSGAFVVERDGQRMAELTYTIDPDGSAVLDHTYVSDELRGQGMGLQLTQSAVDWARGTGIKIVPVCSYARAVFAREHELSDVLRRDVPRG